MQALRILLGTHMLNKCPKQWSCGSTAMWTDEDMPKDIGVSTNVTVYGSASRDYRRDCKAYKIQIEVMRCSLIDHDFIYRYINNGVYGTKYPDFCGLAFCGMM